MQSTNLREVKLLIGTPVHGGFKLEYVESLARTIKVCAGLGIETDTKFIQSSVLHRNRNQILAFFLQSPATHLLFIDSDMSWSPGSVIGLVHFDKEFSGIPGLVLTGELDKAGKQFSYFAASAKNGFELCRETGMLKCDRIGSGFLMLKKSVIQKLIEAYPETQMNGFGPGAEGNQYYYNLFDWGLAEDKTMIGEDNFFCDRWRKIGGEIFIDQTQAVGHVKERILTGELKDHFEPIER